VIDLDFAAMEVPTYTCDASMYLPTRAESPLRNGDGVALVCADNSRYCFGWATPIDISADGNYFNITITYTQPTMADNPFAYYYVRDPLGVLLSMARIQGYPQPGVVDPPLLDMPNVITPSSGTHPVHDLMEWEWFDASVPRTGVRITSGNDLVWMVWAGPDATSAAVPQPPTGVTAADILVTNPRAYVYGGTSVPGFGFNRFARSRYIRVAP
jgi:hypothetical protein